MSEVAEQIEQVETEQPAVEYYGFEPEYYKDYTLGLEPIAKCIEEVRSLHESHWKETEVLYLTRPMDPDYEMFASMEANRQFMFFSIRDADAKIIGNFGFYIALSSHFKGQMMAREDFFFIAKDHRGGGLAREFYRYSEKCLKKLGVKLIGISDKAPCGGKSLAPLLEPEGFKEVATIYIKEVM